MELYMVLCVQHKQGRERSNYVKLFYYTFSGLHLRLHIHYIYMNFLEVDKMAFLVIFLHVTVKNLHILAFVGRCFSSVITKRRQALLHYLIIQPTRDSSSLSFSSSHFPSVCYPPSTAPHTSYTLQFPWWQPRL